MFIDLLRVIAGHPPTLFRLEKIMQIYQTDFVSTEQQHITAKMWASEIVLELRFWYFLNSKWKSII